MSHTSGESTVSGGARRWMRLGTWAAVVLLVLLLAAWWTVTRSWFLVSVLTPQLEERFGGEVTVGSASWEGLNRVELRDVRLRVAWPGEAGELLRVGSVLIETDRPIFSRRSNLTQVTLTDVLARVVEDVEAGQFSVHLLDPPDDLKDERLRPPRIALSNAVIEYGVRAEDGYRASGRMQFTGHLSPLEETENEYQFELRQINDDGRPVASGLFIEGDWNARSFAYRAQVDGFELNDELYRMTPSIIRQWWHELALEGRFVDASMSWDPEKSFDVSIEVERGGLTLPVPTEHLWARYRDGQITDESYTPRMRVDRGRIELSRDTLQLIGLRGELVTAEEGEAAAALPYVVEMHLNYGNIDAAGGRDWARDVVRTAPFEISFESEAAAEVTDRRNVIDLPRPIAQVLEPFQIRNWLLSTRVVMRRDEPSRDEADQLQAASIRTFGEMQIHDGIAMYEKFPYELREIDAQFVFTENALNVEYLRGVGPTGASVRLAGTVEPLSRTPRIDLQVTGKNVPVDDELRRALPDAFSQWFEDLMDGEALEMLREAGYFDPEAVQSELRERRAALESRIDQLRAAGSDDPHDPEDLRRLSLLEARSHRLGRELVEPPFMLGGKVDIEVRIERPEGPGDLTRTSGEASIQSIGLVYNRFPYPFRIDAGTIRWGREGIALLDEDGGEAGLLMHMPRGGTGRIAGTIERIRTGETERDVPDLEISLAGEPLNDLMLAAIPLTPADTQMDVREQWPGVAESDAARLLRSINLEGMLMARGTIAPDAEGRPEHEFAVRILRGSAAPTVELARIIGAAGLFWPEDFAVTDIDGELVIRRDAVELRRVTGRHNDGPFSASGAVETRDDRERLTELNVRLEQLELGTHLINLVPAEEAEPVVAYWDRYQPEGHFNASIAYRARGTDPDPLSISVDGAMISVLVEDERLAIESDAGRIRLYDGLVTFDELGTRFTYRDRDEGRLELAGTYGLLDDDDSLNVDGEWSGLRLESTLVEEIARMIGAEAYLPRYRELKPTGRIDAGFFYRSASGDRKQDYRVRLHPSEVRITLDEEPLAMRFDSDSTVLISPGRVYSRKLAGRFVDDHGRFAVSGTLSLDDDEIEGLFEVSYDGDLRSKSMHVVLPDAVTDVLEQIEFKDGERTVVERASLKLRQEGQEGGETPPWQVDFFGGVRTEGASLSVGVPVTSAYATADLNIRAWEDGPLEFSMTLSGESFRIFGREMTDFLAANVRLDPETGTLRVPEFRGRMHMGVVAGEASIGINDNTRYDVRIDLADVSLKELIADYDPAEADAAPDDATSGREREGRLFGALRLTGDRNDPASRSGRGAIRGMGANLEVLPLVMQVSQAVQLTMPFVAGTLNHANAEFYIEGDRAVFERILFENAIGEIAPLQLIGQGEMQLSDLSLRTTFRSRSGWIVLREVFGTLGDQLYQIEVTGTLLEPKARIIPLPGLTLAGQDPPGE